MNYTTNSNNTIEKVGDDQDDAEMRKTKRLSIISIIVLVVFVGGIVIYNNKYFRESRLYSKIMEQPDSISFKAYYYNFPQGKHIEEIMCKEAQTAAKMPFKTYNHNCVSICYKYMEMFPNGKYFDQLNSLSDSIWNVVIEQYDSTHKAHSNSVYTKYIAGLLQYMKNNHIYTVNLKTDASFELKDLDDFDASIAGDIRSAIRWHNPWVEDCYVEPIKNYFDQCNKNTLDSMIACGYQKFFTELLHRECITVNYKSDDYTSESPDWSIKYTVRNIVDKKGKREIPRIMICHYSNLTHPKYILEFDILFETKSNIPNSDIKLAYSFKSTPPKKIETEESGNELSLLFKEIDVKEAYNRLVKLCILNVMDDYSQKISGEKK